MSAPPGMSLYRLQRLDEYRNWRVGIARIVVNALALALTVLLVPGITIEGEPSVSYLVLALVFGALNALVKPVLQFVAFPLIFVTYGLVIVAVNTAMLWLLGAVSALVDIDGVGALIVGGVVLAAWSLLLENLFGAVAPIVDRTGAGEEHAS